MRKRLHESKYFRLQQEHNAKGRRFYRIVWYTGYGSATGLYDFQEELRNLIDPLRNKSGKHGTNWKFTNRKEAEQMYSMLLLKWA